MINILGDITRKSRYNPDLAQQLAREAELEEKRERLEGKRKPEVKSDVKSEAQAPTNSPIVIPNPNINPREYIQVGINGLSGKPVAISAYELQGSNSKNYEDTHEFLLEKGLYMPTPRIFMAHFKNVMDTKKGVRALNYADGSQVSNSEVEEMYKHLTKNHKNIFGRSDVGAWTWLNAEFDDGNLKTIVGINPDKTFVENTIPLEACLNEDAYINLDFNSQGLASPNAKSQSQSYSQGENIYFWKPVNGRVARFVADSNVAYLNCDGGPTYSNAALGVRFVEP